MVYPQSLNPQISDQGIPHSTGYSPSSAAYSLQSADQPVNPSASACSPPATTDPPGSVS